MVCNPLRRAFYPAILMHIYHGFNLPNPCSSTPEPMRIGNLALKMIIVMLNIFLLCHPHNITRKVHPALLRGLGGPWLPLNFVQAYHSFPDYALLSKAVESGQTDYHLPIQQFFHIALNIKKRKRLGPVREQSPTRAEHGLPLVTIKCCSVGAYSCCVLQCPPLRRLIKFCDANW
ncbi:hypothetical protein L2E82_15041 [Cichorium intybus]|uniref:Uncharacterized protein n=1 Tax=Cichorium intybus TaxID=13427 RepID=A0ACB9F2A6_CICIN|nr:hypothetical protein L2E82_15041 [Cichorium intybus]